MPFQRASPCRSSSNRSTYRSGGGGVGSPTTDSTRFFSAVSSPAPFSFPTSSSGSSYSSRPQAARYIWLWCHCALELEIPRRLVPPPRASNTQRRNDNVLLATHLCRYPANLRRTRRSVAAILAALAPARPTACRSRRSQWRCMHTLCSFVRHNHLHHNTKVAILFFLHNITSLNLGLVERWTLTTISLSGPSSNPLIPSRMHSNEPVPRTHDIDPYEALNRSDVQ